MMDTTIEPSSVEPTSAELTSAEPIRIESTTELPQGLTRATNDTVNDDEIMNGWTLFINYLSDAWKDLDTLRFLVIGSATALVVVILCCSFTILKWKVKF